MPSTNSKKNSPKVLSEPCSSKADSVIYNLLTSAKGDFNVNRKVSISNSSNSVVMRQQDFVDLAKLLDEKSKAGILVQEAREANPKYNTTAVPAIAVIATNLDNQTIVLDIKEGIPGKVATFNFI